MSVRQISWAANRWATFVRRSVAIATVFAAAFTAASSTVVGQEPPTGQPAARRLSDMLPQPETAFYDEAGNAPKRYDEPPPPPFDFWQPTWMPCQSLRTNRSLVLGHLYVGMDIMGWATKGVHAPPLLTVSSLADGGVIGQGNTSVVAGDEFIQNEMRPGGKLTIGWWFDPNQTGGGVEFHYFELDGRRGRVDASQSTEAFVIARPIIDPGTGDNAAVITASDDQTGSIRISTALQLTSTGIMYHDLFWSNQFTRIDYLVGYRHAHLADRIRIDESITGVTGNGDFDAGDTVRRRDQFRTVNQFDGADFGLKGWWSKNGTLAITGLSKIAIGANNNNVIIDGFTAVRSGSSRSTTAGGVLTQPSNIGREAQQQFGIVSEVGLGLEWQPACFWKFNLGYTWFYWSEVARAASQIDTTVDTSGGGSRPAFNMHTTSFWAQGINGGFSYQF